MHDDTIRFYDDYVDSIVKRYESAEMSIVHFLLKKWLPIKGRILEIGCGSGRDAEFMSSILGLNVVATDGSGEMLKRASELHPPNDSLSYIKASFPLERSHELLNSRFDAIVSLAMIMHLPDHELFDFAFQIKEMIKPGGVFICSFCFEREDNHSDLRLYVKREATEIQLLFERLGFCLIKKENNEDALGRKTKWVTLILSYDRGQGDRPIDQIESIINRDRKTATYKLALLRSLCDISQNSYNLVEWHSDNTVSIPLGLIVEKWIQYYWSIIESELFLPEMSAGNNSKKIAFRTNFEQIVDNFRSAGGLNSFWNLLQTNRLTTEQSLMLVKLANTMAKTIIRGPVAYSGGSIDSEEKVFTFKGRQSIKVCRSTTDLIDGFGRVYFHSSIWRELCLVGHWIGEALILRWAELSHSFSKQKAGIADILALLLNTPVNERSVLSVKELYSNQTELYCVWSGKHISRKFDVDHVIPFSLWKNNDLWNLLPADPVINRQKRDRIISMDTLSKSRDLIIHYWQLLKGEFPERFINEVKKTLTGKTPRKENWEIVVFSSLKEAVEIVSGQRGIERWPS